MAAPSPALSPTLTVIVTPLRGLPSGMFCVTMRARPVPTSATVVKLKTVRMNIVSSAALKPSKLRTFAVKVASTIAVPHRPGTPLTDLPISDPTCWAQHAQLYLVAKQRWAYR